MKAPVYRSPYYRVLGVLLDYPGNDFTELLGEVTEFLNVRAKRNGEEVAPVLATIHWMQSLSLLDLEQTYVHTFDLTSKHSLNLTAHLLDEQDRRRGPALIRLREHYENAGFHMVDGELPDYLPAVLEYAATLDEAAAATFLAEGDEALEILEHNLCESKSPYAALVTAVRGSVRSLVPVEKIAATET